LSLLAYTASRTSLNGSILGKPKHVILKSRQILNIPLMRPLLPTADALLPYLRQIDDNGQYTNFGRLQSTLLSKLLVLQANLEAEPVSGVLTSSATLGLELVISCLNLPPNSKILVPALTFVATATAVQRCGHVPVVGDVAPETWMMTTDSLTGHKNLADIQAVIPVATFGMPQNADNWSAWSKENNIPVVIDAASSFGAQKSAPGISVVFSLHATKVLSTGEGGLIVTRDKNLAERLKAMTNFGIGLKQASAGTNTKLSEYHAAVGLAHLDIWPSQIDKRNNLLDLYQQALAPHIGNSIRLQENTGLFATCVFNIQLNDSEFRDHLEVAFEKSGIQTRRWYQPLLQNQPLFKGVIQTNETPNADLLAKTLIGLPFFIGLTHKQVEQICKVFSTN
jgi:dTDP-4-amino-4,6-dideoxygalactose transaminase